MQCSLWLYFAALERRSSLAAAPNHRQGHLVSSGDVDVAVVGVAVPGLECILRRRGVVAVDHC